MGTNWLDGEERLQGDFNLKQKIGNTFKIWKYGGAGFDGVGGGDDGVGGGDGGGGDGDGDGDCDCDCDGDDDDDR